MMGVVLLTLITIAVCPAAITPVLLIAAFISWLGRHSEGNNDAYYYYRHLQDHMTHHFDEDDD